MRGSFHFLDKAFLPQKVIKTATIHGVFFFHGMVEVEKSDFKACGLAIPSPHCSVEPDSTAASMTSLPGLVAVARRSTKAKNAPREPRGAPAGWRSRPYFSRWRGFEERSPGTFGSSLTRSAIRAKSDARTTRRDRLLLELTFFFTGLNFVS